MIRLIARFFDDIHRLANFVTANPTQDINVTLSPEDKEVFMDFFTNYRRNKPRAKKEVEHHEWHP